MLTKKMFLNPTCQFEITVYVKDHGTNIFQVGIWVVGPKNEKDTLRRLVSLVRMLLKVFNWFSFQLEGKVECLGDYELLTPILNF